MECPDCGKNMTKSHNLFYLTWECYHCGKIIPYKIRMFGNQY